MGKVMCVATHGLGMVESQVCDRCGAKMVDSHFSAKRPLHLALPDEEDGEGHFSQVTRLLCEGCEQDLLSWIDGDFERENAVQLPDGYATGETFRRFASELEDMADEMQD